MNIYRFIQSVVVKYQLETSFLAEVWSLVLPSPKVRPQIVVQERLHYTTYIGLRTSVKLKKAEGTIEVVIPAQTQNRTSTKKEGFVSAEKPIGYLALSNYEATVWKSRLRKDGSPGRLREDGFPGKIPIQAPMANENGRPIVRFNYAINSEAATIPARPVFLEAKILDGSSNHNFQRTGVSFYDKLRLQLKISSEVSDQDGEPAGGDEVATKEVQGQVDAPQAQSNLQAEQESTDTEEEAIAAKQTVNGSKEAQEPLPESQALAGRQGDSLLERQGCSQSIQRIFERGQKFSSPPLPPKNGASPRPEVRLAYLEVRTPYIRHLVPTKVSLPDNVERHSIRSRLEIFDVLTKNVKPSNWYYNPERNTLELRELVLGWNKRTNLFEGEVYLDLDPPVKQISELEGSLALCVDTSISKLQVEWSAKKGPEVDDTLPICYRTWITLDFKIDFEQVFENRSLMSERRLHFEGVVFQPDHVANIRHILSNHRLTVLPGDFQDHQAQSRGENDISEHILAIRQGAYADLVWVQVTGQVRKGRHTITYNDGYETLAKTIDLGALDINLFARMTGESVEIDELLNAIQMDLERYFMSNTEGR